MRSKQLALTFISRGVRYSSDKISTVFLCVAKNALALNRSCFFTDRQDCSGGAVD